MLYFYYGQEEYNIELEISKLRAKLVDKKFASANYRVYDNPDFQDLIEVLRTPSLMFGSVVAVINCETYFTGAGKGGFEDSEIKEIEAAVEFLPETLTVIFVCKLERGSSKKVDTRRKLFKIFSKYGSAVEFPEYKSYSKELPAWIQKQAKKKDLTMSSDVVQFLIERVGTNLRVLENELDKLKLAIYPVKNVRKEDVSANCSATEDIFVLCDYVLSGQRDLALSEFKKLCLNHFPLALLATMQTNFSRLITLKIDSASMSPMEISAKTRMHEFVVKKQLEKIRNVSLDRLIKIRKNLLEAEYRMKSGEIAFGELSIEMALLN